MAHGCQYLPLLVQQLLGMATCFRKWLSELFYCFTQGGGVLLTLEPGILHLGVAEIGEGLFAEVGHLGLAKDLGQLLLVECRGAAVAVELLLARVAGPWWVQLHAQVGLGVQLARRRAPCVL